MKQLLTIIFIVALLASSVSYAAIDFSFLQNASEFYIFNYDEERDLCFIETNKTIEDCYIYHDYESSEYYSCTNADILVLDYSTSYSSAVLRLWLEMALSQQMNIDSISITLEDQVFTFSNISIEDSCYSKDNTYFENLLIVFGDDDTTRHFFELLNQNVLEKGDPTSPNHDSSIPITLHGDQDIQASITFSSLYDLLILALGFDGIDGKFRDAVNPAVVSVTSSEINHVSSLFGMEYYLSDNWREASLSREYDSLKKKFISDDEQALIMISIGDLWEQLPKDLQVAIPRASVKTELFSKDGLAELMGLESSAIDIRTFGDRDYYYIENGIGLDLSIGDKSVDISWKQLNHITIENGYLYNFIFSYSPEGYHHYEEFVQSLCNTKLK